MEGEQLGKGGRESGGEGGTFLGHTGLGSSLASLQESVVLVWGKSERWKDVKDIKHESEEKEGLCLIQEVHSRFGISPLLQC